MQSDFEYHPRMPDLRLSLPDLRVVTCPAARRQGFVLGRGAECDVVLADPRVSSRHLCVFPADARGSAWFVSDLGSRHGVTVNGARIAAGTPTPIRDGDTIGAGPVMVRVMGESSQGFAAAHATLIDGLASRVVAPASIVMGVAELRSLSRLGAARSREALFDELLRSVLDITGFARGVIAQVADGDQAVGVLAQRHRGGTAAPVDALSLSLVTAALQGGVAVHDLSSAGAASIIASRTHHACCVRLGDEHVADTAALVLYLDSRGQESAPHTGSTDVAAAFASVAGACLARLSAADLEARHADLRRELHSARAIQEQLHPPTSGTVLGGLMTYHIVSLPGRTVAGDIVDVVDLPARDGRPHRAALVIGDVMGKGAAAGMLMASIQSRLAQGLQDGVPVHELVGAINVDTSRRCPGIMASLWVGVIERAADANRTNAPGVLGAGTGASVAARRAESPGAAPTAADGPHLTLTYVDAGHGMCLHRTSDGAVSRLSAAGGPVIGAGDGVTYAAATTTLNPGDGLCLLTDGLPEQPDAGGTQLGMDAIERCVATPTDAAWAGAARASTAPEGIAPVSATPGAAQTLTTRLVQRLKGHADGTAQRDDVTVLVAARR
jgi:FHA domain/Stage II sporulation protein E (SpoIIE)